MSLLKDVVVKFADDVLEGLIDLDIVNIVAQAEKIT